MTVPHFPASLASTLSRSGVPARGWKPDEIGLPRAVALAVSVVAVLIGGFALLADRMVSPVPPPPVTVQLMDTASAMLVPALAAVPPAPMAVPVPPTPVTLAAPPAEALAPTPAVTPTPVLASAATPLAEAAPMPEMEAPMPSPIAAPTQASPPDPTLPPAERPRLRPAQRATRSPPVPRDALGEVAVANAARAALASLPATPLTTLPPPAAPTAPADVSSGLGPYRAGLHRQIERNMLSDRAIERLGVSGSAMIEATIAPEGRVVAARLTRSSGIRAIDEAALGAVQRGGFPAFGPHMPAGPITVSVPIGVEAN